MPEPVDSTFFLDLGHQVVRFGRGKVLEERVASESLEPAFDIGVDCRRAGIDRDVFRYEARLLDNLSLARSQSYDPCVEDLLWSIGPRWESTMGQEGSGRRLCL